MTTPQPSTSRLGETHAALISRFLSDCGPPRSTTSLAHAGSAARHFLRWTSTHHIPIDVIDDDVVERFRRHRCACPRYSARQVREPAYLGQVRRFVCFLENQGAIVAPSDRVDVGAYLDGFAEHLAALGHGRSVRLGYSAQAAHFVSWLRVSRIRWTALDEGAIERFALHKCRCPIRAKRGVRVPGTGPAHRRRGARRFCAYLRRQGAIAPCLAVEGRPTDGPLGAYRTWLAQERGATDATIRRYIQEATRWLPRLGPDPARYTAAAVRSVVIEQEPSRSRSSIRMTVTVLRSFLRFAASASACSAALAEAVPPAVRRRLATLPRYAAPSTIEAIIASCDGTTPVGVRDRAIILLLARLGLRAADVWRLRLEDVDWRDGRLRLHGKQRRSVAMPLPQDVGEALLAYITGSRPVVAEQHVFLRAQAPFTPFRSAAEIAGIVARVLKRGGIAGVPTGAHMFAYSDRSGRGFRCEAGHRSDMKPASIPT
ncbi:tyrosine-type recombinase/integrase [Methylobacterium isbiliense]|uniref:Tyrosine recombinase XerC n=1 Tax=Methylobacterium isbiliense TaxID=315478 RepID=A0ABQ4SKH1_9HYPH|nr:tyrosine-type recombinase/integrase [Methylobacterium isbiliense]MDN3626169.1 tyrosine-type recombinase/integrase [Methylobacterium isbiliense]GJE02980.1 Tyrosine recombinase XerC [Methylobacterium isbiliense]